MSYYYFTHKPSDCDRRKRKEKKGSLLNGIECGKHKKEKREGK
jgi:hypothetical protein